MKKTQGLLARVLPCLSDLCKCVVVPVSIRHGKGKRLHVQTRSGFPDALALLWLRKLCLWSNLLNFVCPFAMPQLPPADSCVSTNLPSLYLSLGTSCAFVWRGHMYAGHTTALLGSAIQVSVLMPYACKHSDLPNRHLPYDTKSVYSEWSSSVSTFMSQFELNNVHSDET